ncbi:MAG: hypothetical protein JNM65_04505 [Verrucomicrobiaceae bacterium]|nr:hypothetical protein [Verrucomicrobiaceae bacterium]
MKIACLFLFFTGLLHSQEVLKFVKNPAERGTLSDQRQLVRGDTGKWNDAAMLLHTTKPTGMPLDDWMDAASEKKPVVTAADESWLLFRTRQLDDNDRVWIEKIERSGNAFTITMHEAIWQGKYFKTFTWYEVTAVNLGKLPAGDYTVTWIVKPLTFKQLEKPREAQNNYQTNWPADEQSGEKKPVEIKTKFTVQ